MSGNGVELALLRSSCAGFLSIGKLRRVTVLYLTKRLLAVVVYLRWLPDNR
jgi:hypothetical protein